MEISWNDSEDDYGYDVLIHSEAENAAPDIVLKGLYNAETKKLECLDPETYAARFDGDTESAADLTETFSFTESGSLFLEGESLELVNYDLLPDESDNG